MYAVVMTRSGEEWQANGDAFRGKVFPATRRSRRDVDSDMRLMRWHGRQAAERHAQRLRRIQRWDEVRVVAV
jgi:hypothetical protein